MFSRVRLAPFCPYPVQLIRTKSTQNIREARRRVVVTGLGLVSPLGVGVEQNWRRLLNGETGLTRLKTEHEFGSIRSAGYIPCQELNLNERFSATDRRTQSLATLYALIAAEEALLDAGLCGPDHPKIQSNHERTGISLGQGMVDLEFVQQSIQRGKLSPFFVTRLLPNLAGGQMAIRFGCKGPNLCQSTACASGLHSIGDAFQLIRSGKAEVMLAGGTEACLNKLGIEAFARMRALSQLDPEAGPSRPFDQDRDGFVLGEGAGLLVLEDLDHARQRGASIKTEIVGFGASCDAHHTTAPLVDGARRSIGAAIEDCHGLIKPDQIGYVNAHATSTPLGDENELRACEEALSVNKNSTVLISSNKAAIGHLLGASGAVESVFAVLSCQLGLLPPTINCQKPMDTTLDIVTGQGPREWPDQRRIALKNSFGFGGTNASLLMENYS